MQIGATSGTTLAVNSYAQAQATPLPVDAAQGRAQAAPVQTQAAVRPPETTQRGATDVKSDMKREDVSYSARGPAGGNSRDGSIPRPGSLLDIRV